MSYTLYKGDCLEEMKKIEDGSVDMILCDPPYGTTQAAWDCVIPIVDMWAQYERICRGAIVLTATQPFSSALVSSNYKAFRHEWVWDRVNRKSGHLNAKIAPMRIHELALVFSSGKYTYNPQMVASTRATSTNRDGARNSLYGRQSRHPNYDSSVRYPTDVISIKADDPRVRVHPTQKPVALMEYLIRTYTNEGDVVMDNCMGSGTTGVACANTGRKFIGIERDDTYFEIAKSRIEQAFDGRLI